MHLGAFSVSLCVKDIHASLAFYSALGFKTDMDPGAGWLILRNGDTTIGLFQDMFEGNLLTFNPRWDQDATPNSGPDIREIQAELKAKGLPLETEVPSDSSGPGSLTLRDPDGNVILLDQHV